MPRPRLLLFLLITTLCAFWSPTLVQAQTVTVLDVQGTLDRFPGPLKDYREDGRTAAAIIEDRSLYYNLSPRLHLALAETLNGLLRDPAAPAESLQSPFGLNGPDGFAAQVEWVSRELRAGLGPYTRPPVVRFTDGLTATISLDQIPEGIAVQRFLAQGRTFAEWQDLTGRFNQVFAEVFANELLQPPTLSGNVPPLNSGPFTLWKPWPAGTQVVHLAYFDHLYPLVDRGGDRNGMVVTFRGYAEPVQYDGHDGHDYVFPAGTHSTPMLASAPGMAYAREDFRGKGVVIVHADGYETVYWHLDQFSPELASLVGSNNGLWVTTGTQIGISGSSGIRPGGTPHLHFEVRRFGLQVDPYGWYGVGPDPCLSYPYGDLCYPSGWLWHPDLVGSYNFTPPDLLVAQGDTTPPLVNLTINPPADLRFYADFDESPLQQIGNGFPAQERASGYREGRFGMALDLPPGSIWAMPVADNFMTQTGTLSLWAEIPQQYAVNPLNRHYLFAASGNPRSDPIYTNTFSLRRDLLGPENTPQWNFWTTGEDGQRNDLSFPDTLAAGWHHFAVTWDRATGSKALYLNGEQVASVDGVSLPSDFGEVLELGRFVRGGGPGGMAIDEFAIFDRVFTDDEINGLAFADSALDASVTRVIERELLLDLNALDNQSGLAAVQIGRDDDYEDPLPYYDSYRWMLPDAEGEYTINVRVFDVAGNSSEVSRTVTLAWPPRLHQALFGEDESLAWVLIAAEDIHTPLEMKLSQHPDLHDGVWRPYEARYYWRWQLGLPKMLFVQVRDAEGELSPIVQAQPGHEIFLPLVFR